MNVIIIKNVTSASLGVSDNTIQSEDPNPHNKPIHGRENERVVDSWKILVKNNGRHKES